MRCIGFSTGAIAHSDFDYALQLMVKLDVKAVELSALRIEELQPLITALDRLELRSFTHVSVHAPSSFSALEEVKVIEQLRLAAARGYCVVVHPDTMHDVSAWRVFEDRLCIENMDKRKPVGRTTNELRHFFQMLPLASMCFDIAHARQVDSSMTEAYRLLRDFGARVRQVHVSEVNTNSGHSRMSPSAADDFSQVVDLIPVDAAWIIEAQVASSELVAELASVYHLISRTPP